MLNSLLSFWVFWGIWIVVPFLLDGTTAMTLLLGVLISRWKQRKNKKPRLSEYTPFVSIIIPVFNGEKTIENCLESIRRQSYPTYRLEIVVVNNGSTDRTEEIFSKVQALGWSGQMHIISIPYKSKPWALNTGIHLTSGEYIINIDADVVLHPNAIREMINAFESDPNIVATTGAVEVLPAPKRYGRLPFLIAECEFQEYITAFWMGRQYQSLTNSLFTLAGAFSGFRRDVLLTTFLYDKLTVSEDTKLTLDIYRNFKKNKIICVPDAVAYVTSTRNLGALYAQRVRWQRGQLEVAALNPELFNLNILQLRGLSLSRLLMIDHTLIFPRMIWMVLFPLMTMFDYPISLVLSASLFMYAFYALINLITSFAAFIVVGVDEKRRLLKHWWIALIMPAYRFLIFLFRIGGSIIALTDAAEWRVQDPIAETRQALIRLKSDLKEYFVLKKI